MTERHPFHTLLTPQTRALKQFALRLTGNDHRAEDLVQATMLKAWAKRDSFKPDTHLSAWLFTILRNTFYSDLRKYRREVEDVDGIFASTLSEQPRQVDVIALKELMSAIEQLPQQQRKAVVLMGIYGFSQLEAASACGCKVGTIKSRVSRGRIALSQALEYDLPDLDLEIQDVAHAATDARPQAADDAVRRHAS